MGDIIRVDFEKQINKTKVDAETQQMKDELNSIVPMTDFQARQLSMIKTEDTVVRMENVAHAKKSHQAIRANPYTKSSIASSATLNNSQVQTASKFAQNVALRQVADRYDQRRIGT